MNSEVCSSNGIDTAETPLISVLMAIYQPNQSWLRDQLASIEQQDYRNIELLIIDDCSEEESVRLTRQCIYETIICIPYTFNVNESNIGSTKTFQKLTSAANGQYIAYCDQDDIWFSHKLSKLYCQIKQTQSDLVFSDMYVINNSNEILSDSITKVRKNHVFSMDNPASVLLYRNFVTGCTILINANAAKLSLPFIECMVHDHYLALYCAIYGKISFCSEPLIQYRMHERNQTGVLSNVIDKSSYYTYRVLQFQERIDAIASRFSFPALKEASKWSETRLAFFYQKPLSRLRYWRLRKTNLRTTLFELFVWNMPDCIFRWLILQIKKYNSL